MLTKMKRRTLTVSLTSTLMLVSTGSFGAVTVLKNCFGAPQTYSIDYHHEFTSTENVANNDYDIPGHLVGAGADLEANCTCPGNMFSSSTVYEKTLAGSPLNPGTSGTGYLTDKIDAHITGYADAINSPDGSSLTPIPINEYPTPRGNMLTVLESSLSKTEEESDVCSNDSRPDGGAASKRKFRWNVVAVLLHIKTDPG
jgi:hypothetical protein